MRVNEETDVTTPQLTKAAAGAMASPSLQPITPEPWFHYPRAGDPALSSRPDSTASGGLSASPPCSDGDSHCSEEAPSLDDPLAEAEPAALAARLAAAEAEAAALRSALARQAADAAARLEAEHDWAAATVQQATDVACSLRDANVALAAEADALRARVAQLETDLAGLELASEPQVEDEGAEGLIAALQVEIADLERRLHRAGRARAAAAETEEAALHRADILRQQVEHMAGLLEEERAEKERLQAALEVAGLLPPAAAQRA